MPCTHAVKIICFRAKNLKAGRTTVAINRRDKGVLSLLCPRAVMAS